MQCKHIFFLLLFVIKSSLIYCQFRKARHIRRDYVYIDHVNNFYKINKLPKTWSDAKSKCSSDGATLFYPENDVEAEAVIDLLKKKQRGIEKIWISVAAWNAKEYYETIDGRNISDVYKKWAFNERDNAGGNEGCVVMQKDGTIKDENCDIRYSYICKKKKTLATEYWDSKCGLPVTGYKYVEDMKKCYKFHLTAMNWTDAYTLCQAEQSYLAIINSNLEDEHLINITALAPKEGIKGYLMGAVHLGFHSNNGFWETIEGVPLRDSGFGDGWGYQRPDRKGRKTCGSMLYNGPLNDVSCSTRMFFICEHDLEPPPTKVKNKTARHLATMAAVRSFETRGGPEPYFLATAMIFVILAVIQI